MALEDFAARYAARNPSLFETVIYSAAEARLHALRAEHIGPAQFRLVTATPCDRERFERLLAERVPASIYLWVDVESAQPAPALADQ